MARHRSLSSPSVLSIKLLWFRLWHNSSISKSRIASLTSKANTHGVAEGYLVCVMEFFFFFVNVKIRFVFHFQPFLAPVPKYSYQGKAAGASIANISQSACHLPICAASVWPPSSFLRSLLCPSCHFLVFLLTLATCVWSNQSPTQACAIIRICAWVPGSFPCACACVFSVATENLCFCMFMQKHSVFV